jgi:hypothetical protein
LLFHAELIHLNSCFMYIQTEFLDPE